MKSVCSYTTRNIKFLLSNYWNASRTNWSTWISDSIHAPGFPPHTIYREVFKLPHSSTPFNCYTKPCWFLPINFIAGDWGCFLQCLLPDNPSKLSQSFPKASSAFRPKGYSMGPWGCRVHIGVFLNRLSKFLVSSLSIKDCRTECLVVLYSKRNISVHPVG